ncbi:MAG: CbiX/SirB N-terminal domain-containing protein, partial [Polaromonas sp.]
MTADTVLLVGHGSREPSGNDEIEAFAQQWRARQPGWRIEVCFIEFGAISLSEGLRRAATGAQRVLVVPLILNAAGHVKMDIPQAIDAARLKFAQVQFLYAPHLTACDPILAIVRRRLKGAMQALDMPDPTTTGVVLLGRGSSDRQANGEMAKMARWLMEETDHELVDVAFTGITWPRLEKAVQRQV